MEEHNYVVYSKTQYDDQQKAFENEIARNTKLSMVCFAVLVAFSVFLVVWVALN